MGSRADTTAVAHRAARATRTIRLPPDALPAPGHWGAAAAITIGAALRVAWMAYARPEPVSDFLHYLRLALELVDAGTFGVGEPSAWRLPAYPVVLAAGALVNRDPVALSALTTAISVLQIGMTYWAAWRIFGRRSAATAAALTAAVAPAFVTFAPVLASEHLLAVLVLAAICTALPARRVGWRAALSTGVLLGAAILTRGEAVAYVPVIVLTVAADRLRRGQRTGQALRAAAVTMTAALLVVGPWIVRNERVVGAGAGLTTTGGFNFYLAHSPGGYGWRRPLPPPLLVTDEIARDDLGWRYGMHHVRRHPEQWWPTVRRGTRELLAPSWYAARYATVRFDSGQRRLVARADLGLRAPAIDLTGSSSRWLLLAGLAGLLRFGVWRRPGWFAVAGIVAANWVVYAVIFWAQARYRFVVDAVACVAVGALPSAIASVSGRVTVATRGAKAM